jgi:valyl-tRNA synthetase
MEPRYDIKSVEACIYKKWEDSGFFNPDACVREGVTARDAEPFSMVLPPPNVTGVLHIGHAFEDALQDIAVRFARMQGRRTLWVPGTDHAAIATQSKVEKDLAKTEKKSRHDLGREEFLRHVNKFAKASHDTIVRQIKRMGASLDWSREAYTLDEKRSQGVRTAFQMMYDLGLIYRGNRIVNWDPKGQTVISDDEVQHEERRAKLYTFRYGRLANGELFPIPVATTRLETKFGDTAVAVHPTDERYRKFVGKEYDVPFCGAPLHIKVVADESVDPAFGTGAVGVTPAHSMTDWEIAERHGLPHVQVINEYGKMTVPGPVNGKKTEEAREWVAEELRKQGLIEKEEEVVQNVSVAERTGGIIEPLPKLQWFVAVNKPFKRGFLRRTTLKQLMRDAVASGRVRIGPERFEKIYFHWIDNLRDWCISRQIWFGHRVPVWYKGEQVSVGAPPAGAEGWEQDPDTLDTWFSSALWPFSTLGWPEKNSPDLATYFPNTLMAPGYEILFLWVARMILMSGVLLDSVPFRTVLIHGIVRDAKGQKFSKSLGNGIDPLELADTYGADALRMGLIVGAAPGNDVKFDEQRVKGYRNFSTKIWNIARFIQMNKPAAGGGDTSPRPDFSGRAEVKELAALKKEVSAHLEAFEFHLAAEKLYHYIWHTLADKIVEEQKAALRDGTPAEKSASYALLESLLLDSLKMLHPFMPFVTEEVYGIFRPGKMLMVEAW